MCGLFANASSCRDQLIDKMCVFPLSILSNLVQMRLAFADWNPFCLEKTINKTTTSDLNVQKDEVSMLCTYCHSVLMHLSHIIYCKWKNEFRRVLILNCIDERNKLIAGLPHASLIAVRFTCSTNIVTTVTRSRFVFHVRSSPI